MSRMFGDVYYGDQEAAVIAAEKRAASPGEESAPVQPRDGEVVEFHGHLLTAMERDLLRRTLAAYPGYDGPGGLIDYASYEAGATRVLLMLRADLQDLERLRGIAERFGAPLIPTSESGRDPLERAYAEWRREHPATNPGAPAGRDDLGELRRRLAESGAVPEGGLGAGDPARALARSNQDYGQLLRQLDELVGAVELTADEIARTVPLAAARLRSAVATAKALQ